MESLVAASELLVASCGILVPTRIDLWATYIGSEESRHWIKEDPSFLQYQRGTFV